MLLSTVYTNTDLEMGGLCTNPWKMAILRMILLVASPGGTTGPFIIGLVVIPWCFLA